MRAFVLILTTVFVLAFASMTMLGGYMAYQQVRPSSQRSDVEVTVRRDSLELRLEQATPGLIIFCFGAVGLILMVYRIPTKEVLAYRTEGGNGRGSALMLRRKVLDERITNIPLPLWWLLKRTDRFERVDDSA